MGISDFIIILNLQSGFSQSSLIFTKFESQGHILRSRVGFLNNIRHINECVLEDVLTENLIEIFAAHNCCSFINAFEEYLLSEFFVLSNALVNE